MKDLLNKKGFTLIELLAVIVVLAIVMVLATTTVLPYMNTAASKAFVTEANGAIDAASQAITLMSIGSIDEPTTGADYKKTVTESEGVTTTKYCFSLKQLVELGIWTKDIDAVSGTTPEYAGTVVATKTSNSNAYSYAVEMHNADLYVKSAAGTIDANAEDEVLDYGDGTGITLKTSCN